MNDYASASRELAAHLAAGEYQLTNHDLREYYGLGRVTTKARTDIAYALQRAGLEILSDPVDEPLVVRKSAPARLHRTGARASGDRPLWRRPGLILTAAIVLLLIIVLASSNGGSSHGNAPRDDSASSGVVQAATATTGEHPTATLADAADKVDEDHYAAAIAIAAKLGDDDRHRISRKISRRLAQRAIHALRNGQRSGAHQLLNQADAYPTTVQIAAARVSYRAAKARAAARRTAEANPFGSGYGDGSPDYSPPDYSPPETPAPSVGTVCDSGTPYPQYPGQRDGDGDGCYGET